MSTFFVYISTSFFYAFKFFNINICKHNICTVLCKFNRCCSPYSYGCSRNKYCLLIKIHIINLFHFIDITSYYLLSLLRLSKAVVQMLQERHIRLHINHSPPQRNKNGIFKFSLSISINSKIFNLLFHSISTGNYFANIGTSFFAER